MRKIISGVFAKSNRRGHTLLELMTAITLSLMVLMIALPMTMSGYKIYHRISERNRAAYTGDLIFDSIADELRLAARVSLGGVNPISIEDGNDWNMIDHTFMNRDDLVIETQVLGKNLMNLTVKLVSDDRILYERSETLELLNLEYGGIGEIEGTKARGRRTDSNTIRYQSVEKIREEDE